MGQDELAWASAPLIKGRAIMMLKSVDWALMLSGLLGATDEARKAGRYTQH